MLAGGGEADKTHWELTAAPEYHYLNQSGMFSLREVDDAEEYGIMRAAMTTMGIQVCGGCPCVPPPPVVQGM